MPSQQRQPQPHQPSQQQPPHRRPQQLPQLDSTTLCMLRPPPPPKLSQPSVVPTTADTTATAASTIVPTVTREVPAKAPPPRLHTGDEEGQPRDSNTTEAQRSATPAPSVPHDLATQTARPTPPAIAPMRSLRKAPPSELQGNQQRADPQGLPRVPPVPRLDFGQPQSAA